MSPEYWSCPSCHGGDFHVRADGTIACGDWDECGVVVGTWTSTRRGWPPKDKHNTDTTDGGA
jgi:hypothetical protein